jgi:hypothetical protein
MLKQTNQMADLLFDFQPSGILISWEPHVVLQHQDCSPLSQANITKMYRHISTYRRDRDSQGILWRHSPNSPISEYQLTAIHESCIWTDGNHLLTTEQLSDRELHRRNMATSAKSNSVNLNKKDRSKNAINIHFVVEGTTLAHQGTSQLTIKGHSF